MSSLHPYGLQKYAYIGVAFIALANFVFGALYLFAIGIFNEGGGSYTASMRYLTPGLSLVVAVVLIQDYTLTIVVSALSGGDQLLSILNLYGRNWAWHFMIGAGLAAITWYLTIRGRGKSSFITFVLLGLFVELTVVMAVGLFTALSRGVPPAPIEIVEHPSIQQALYHMLTATMKGIVALSGLEAVSNGIQFFKHEDFTLVRWGKQHAPRLQWLWRFYSGKSGIGRVVQTAFLFYGSATTLFLTYFSLHFNVFDGTFGRSLVGNLSFIGFTQVPGGTLLFWIYQILAVALLAAASMTALPGCAGDRVARRCDRRDPRGHHLPRPAWDIHTLGDHYVHRRRPDHARRSRAHDPGGAVLWCGRLHADHGHGVGHPQAHPGELHRPAADLGGGRQRRLPPDCRPSSL